jgi:hypothetical protein
VEHINQSIEALLIPCKHPKPLLLIDQNNTKVMKNPIGKVNTLSKPEIGTI